jgi:hypothetical protein
MKFLLHAYYALMFVSTKACGLAIFFKPVLASSKATFVASTIPSLEIPNYS